jgi:TatD DNase family protein
MTLELFDSHCHVDHEAFAADREAVIERAFQSGVREMLVVGASSDIEAARGTVEFAAEREGFYPSVGVHPHGAHLVSSEDFEEFRALAARPDVVAIGESGLDYFYDSSPPAAQRESFLRHIELAKELGKPLICHIRDAHEEASELLAGCSGKIEVVIHCFTGTPDEAERYVDLGFAVSFSGIVTFKGKSADPIRAAVEKVPLDRLLIETDAPYLAPVPLRGKRNEPSFLAHTAEVVARAAKISPEELARQSRANTHRVFALTSS